MAETIYSVFEPLIKIPFNIWPWLLLCVAPISVFLFGPESSGRWRIGRLLLTIAAIYALWNLTIHTHQQLEWATYKACQSQFSDGADQHHNECGNPFMGNGAQLTFAAILGWIPAMAYLGLWEWLWRYYHRHRIRQLGNAFKGRWLSNTLVGFGVFLFVLCPVAGVLIYMAGVWILGWPS